MKSKKALLSIGLTLIMLCTMLMVPIGALAGGPTTIQLTAQASGQGIVLNWNAPTNATGLSGYYIYRGTSSGGELSGPIEDFPVKETTYTDTPLSSGTYYYFVKPVYNQTTPGAPSNEASATVGAAASGVVATGTITVIFQVGNPIMIVNGVSKPIDDGGTTPVIVDGRTFVPLRAIVEALGGTTTYNAATKTVTIVLGSNTIELTIGSTAAKVNGVPQTLGVAPFVSDTNRTMIPLRFATESLGCQVLWDGDNQKITITYTGALTPVTTTTTVTATGTTTPVIPGTPAGNGTSTGTNTNTNTANNAISGLAAQYKMNGDFTDVAGGNNGTASGSVTFADDPVVGKCAVFNGGYVTVKSSDELNLGSNFTITVWVMVDPTMAIPNNKDGPIISKLDTAGVYNVLHWYTKGTYGTRADLRTNQGEKSVQNKAFTDYKMHQSWTQLAFSGDGQNLYLYCNGTQINKQPIGTGVSITTSTGDLRIGNGCNINAKTLFYIGKMADLRIYNRTLSDSDISTIYTNGANK